MFVLLQNDGLVRVNGDSTVEYKRESPVRPVSFNPTPPKSSQSRQQMSEISAGSELSAQECTQISTIQKTEPIKQRTEDEMSKSVTDSELAGWRHFCSNLSLLLCVCACCFFSV